MTQKLPPIDHGYSWVIVAVATVVFMLNVGVFRSQSVFLEPVKLKFNVSHGWMTLMSSGMTITSQLITLPGNVMNEWFGPRVNVGVAGLCGILCYLICSIAPIFPVYFASYVLLQGAAFGLCYSPVVVTVNRYFREYRPLASSIALCGVSIGSMIIPNFLRWALNIIGLQWVLFSTAIIMALTIPIGLFLRLITHEQLAALDAQHKKSQASSTAAATGANNEEEKAELVAMQNKNENNFGDSKADPDSITKAPLVVSVDGPPDAKVTPAPELPVNGQNATPAVEIKEEKETKKSDNFTAAFAYFKHMPALFKNPTVMLHAIHFAVIMSVEMLFVSVSFDSFVANELLMSERVVLSIRTLFAIGNFIGRLGSGLVVVMPVLIAKCRQQPVAKSSATPANTSCFGQLKKCINVRAVYCLASFVLTLTFLVIAISGLSSRGTSGQQQQTQATNMTGSTNLTSSADGTIFGNSTENITTKPILTYEYSVGWSWILMLTFHIVGISAGCLFSQFPVVLAELVGLQRLGAGHAIFMLVQVPVSCLHFVSGVIKGQTGSWGIAYMLLFVITLLITVLNSASLLLGGRFLRCRPASAAHA